MASRLFFRIALLCGAAFLFAVGDFFARPLPRTQSADGSSRPSLAWAQLKTYLDIEQAISAYNEGALFIDARPENQYSAGHIEGAIHLDLAAFRAGRTEVVDSLPTDFKLVIYCGGGDCDASHRVAELLAAQGYSDVVIMGDGYEAWRDAGLPTASLLDVPDFGEFP